MGESKLGSGASSWILHMSTTILTANFWGIYRKEWKGVARKTKWTKGCCWTTQLALQEVKRYTIFESNYIFFIN